MNNNKENHKKEVEDIYRRYLKNIKECNEKKMLSIAMEIYEEIDKINTKYRMLNNPSQIDELNAYYTICRIIESGYISDKYFEHRPDELEVEKRRLANKLIIKLKEKKLDMILIIEPHHDDALGSSSSLLFDTNSIVTLYTIAKSGDIRDNVDLSEIGKRK